VTADYEEVNRADLEAIRPAPDNAACSRTVSREYFSDAISTICDSSEAAHEMPRTRLLVRILREKLPVVSVTPPRAPGGSWNTEL
jgi:hypothetical protein